MNENKKPQPIIKKDDSKSINESLKNPRTVIMDIIDNQFSSLGIILKVKGIEGVKALVTNLKNFKEYEETYYKDTDLQKVIEDVEKFRPYFSKDYDDFIVKLKNPNLTLDEAQKILGEIALFRKEIPQV